MSAIDEILSQIPLSDLAARLGVDEQTAEAATRQALPALLGGMRANAEDPSGARSLADALGRHTPTLIDGGVNLADVDPDDGDKIVRHVFGQERDQVINTLGGVDTKDLVAKLLPILAPIVMSYLAKKFGGGQQGGGLGDLLGGLLGGKAGGLGDLLGGLLGGGRK